MAVGKPSGWVGVKVGGCSRFAGEGVPVGSSRVGTRVLPKATDVFVAAIGVVLGGGSGERGSRVAVWTRAGEAIVVAVPVGDSSGGF